LSIITFIIAFLILNAADYQKETRVLVYILVLFAFLKSFTELLFSVFKAYEAMHYEAILKILRMLAALAFGLLAISLYKDIILLSVIFLAIEAVIFILSFFIILSKFEKIRLSFDYEFSKKFSGVQSRSASP